MAFSCDKKCENNSSVFIDNCDGTMTDNRTNLTWIKEPSNKKLNWKESMEYAKNHKFAGYSDWRLPTKAEWKLFAEATGYSSDEWYKNRKTFGLLGNWLCKQGFRNINYDEFYWSSSLYESGHEAQGLESNSAYYIKFEYGEINSAVMSCCKAYTWLVRDGSIDTKGPAISFIEYGGNKIEIIDDQFSAYTIANNITLRKYPSNHSEAIGYYKMGTKLIVKRRTKEMYSVNERKNYWYLCGNYTGWIFGDYINKGEFSKSDYINNLPEITNTPAQFNEVLKYSYIECPLESLVGENMNCVTWQFRFRKNVIIFAGLPPKLDSAIVYKILSCEEINSEVFIKAELLFTYYPIDTIDTADKITTIKINRNIDTIQFGKRTIYKFKAL
jgi:hypothetical protein